jgi:hypothetical protein
MTDEERKQRFFSGRIACMTPSTTMAFLEANFFQQ